MKKGDVKAQSGILVVVLLILLVIVGIVILWNVVMFTLKGGSEQIGIDQFLLKGTLKYFIGDSPTDHSINVSVTRGTGVADIKGVKLIFNFADGNSRDYLNKTVYPKELETITYAISNNTLNVADFSTLAQISLYYIVVSNGKESYTVKLDTQNGPSAGSMNAAGGSGEIISVPTNCTQASECNDNNICTTDTCTAGACNNAANTLGCDDGNPCTTNDVCSAGTCTGGTGCGTQTCCTSGCINQLTDNNNCGSCGNNCTAQGKTCLNGICVVGQAKTYLNFTTCGATGRIGPTQAQCNTNYTGTSLAGKVTVIGGFQYWTIPDGVTSITIEAVGAAGGAADSPKSPVGRGARIIGTFTVTPGEDLKILVGQRGTRISSGNSGGGGGSFVTDTGNSPLIIAGGGGGQYTDQSSTSGSHATITTSGNSSGCSGAAGGSNGNGGGGCGSSNGGVGGGAGLNGNGGNGYNNYARGGVSFVNGGTGGDSGYGSFGGFGGGGSSYGSDWGGGGGGGYSGGGGGYRSLTNGNGGGGASYNSGTNKVMVTGFNYYQGKINIMY
ncbi:MAG: hypothetical protein WC979_06760 [Candidatus Pacearchaeota archaeon]|jgi:hypothetical protein